MTAPDGKELRDFLEARIAEHGNGAGSVLNVLNDVQDAYRYVPVEALYGMSIITGRSFAELCSVVSTFDNLTTDPVGKHLILVCDGTACHAVGAGDIIRTLEDKLGIACGQTTPDGEFTLKSVFCVGACSLAPIVIIDDAFCGHVRLSELDGTLKRIGSRRGGPSHGD